MLIVADENMPLLEEFFAGLGEIRRLPGRAMTAADVADADLLLVRSVTRVDAALLARATPRFVGTATIGTDHVDTCWLAERGIPFAAAPGCNAVAVAEYVCTVLALHADRSGRELAGQCLGVIGCGNVGRAVVPRAQALGLQVVVCDPLLPRDTVPAGVTMLDLDALLARADILTLHVPFTRGGDAPTWHLLDEARLSAGRWQLLLNTARGPVVDNAALHALLAREPSRRVVLDVWEDEPAVPPALLSRCWLGTPHIAGYSLEGKWRGTEQVYRAACSALGIAPRISLADIRARAGDAPRELAWPGTLAGLLATCCDVRGDDARLRTVVSGDARDTAVAFDRLRRHYAERREFASYRVRGIAAGAAVAQKETPRATSRLLAALGFVVED